MALENIKNRIRKAQAKTHTGEALGLVANAIARGAYYDELTEEEKNAYCGYIGSEREALETINGYILGNLHFQVEQKSKPLTEEQLKERAQEVETYIQARIEEYNARKGN